MSAAQHPRPPLFVQGPAAMAEWLKDELGTGALSGVFRRQQHLVHCPLVGENGYLPPKDDDDDDGPAQVQRLNQATLAAQIQYGYWCHKINDSGPYPAMFPEDAARVAVNAVHLLDQVRPLRGVVHAPIVRRDGSVLAAPGYDDATGLLYLPAAGLVVPPVPEEPTGDDVAAAVGLLDSMTAGFRFLTDSDRANYYGLMLTPLLRELCPPPYKMGAISAPQPGSGKTLLATVLRMIHGGVFRSEFPGEADELRKAISTILDVTTGPVITSTT